jgi:hypothetical protein
MLLDRIIKVVYDRSWYSATRTPDGTDPGGAYFADPTAFVGSAASTRAATALRQSLPKRSDLSGFSRDELDALAWQLDTRLRKSSNWLCPAEVFMPESFDFKQHFPQLVALRT